MSEMLVCYIVPADLKDRRGLPMSIFSAAALGGTGLGPVVAGWVELNPKLGWRWIQWIQMMRVYFFFPNGGLIFTLDRNCGAYSLLLSASAERDIPGSRHHFQYRAAAIQAAFRKGLTRTNIA